MQYFQVIFAHFQKFESGNFWVFFVFDFLLALIDLVEYLFLLYFLQVLLEMVVYDQVTRLLNMSDKLFFIVVSHSTIFKLYDKVL